MIKNNCNFYRFAKERQMRSQSWFLVLWKSWWIGYVYVLIDLDLDAMQNSAATCNVILYAVCISRAIKINDQCKSFICGAAQCMLAKLKYWNEHMKHHIYTGWVRSRTGRRAHWFYVIYDSRLAGWPQYVSAWSNKKPRANAAGTAGNGVAGAVS